MSTSAAPAAGGAPERAPAGGTDVPASDDEVLVRATGMELLGEVPGSG